MNIKAIINPKYAFLKDYLEKIPYRKEDLGTVIYTARNTVFKDIVSVKNDKGEQQNIELIIKSFKIPPLYNRFAYTFLRHGKAQASYLNALKLTEKGFLTPEPVACIRCYKNMLLERSYYVSLKVNGEEIRFWENIPNNERLLRALAQLMVNLHSKGVYHRDFSPGNVLFDEEMNLNLLDINRMKFDITSHAKLMRNFQSLNESLAETLKLAKYYAEAQRSDVNVIQAEALKAYNRYHNLRRRKQRFKKVFKALK